MLPHLSVKVIKMFDIAVLILSFKKYLHSTTKDLFFSTISGSLYLALAMSVTQSLNRMFYIKTSLASL